jgi:hypothetical protein
VVHSTRRKQQLSRSRARGRLKLGSHNSTHTQRCASAAGCPPVLGQTPCAAEGAAGVESSPGMALQAGARFQAGRGLALNANPKEPTATAYRLGSDQRCWR